MKKGLVIIMFSLVSIISQANIQDKFKDYTGGTRVSVHLLNAIMQVESNGRNIIGDKHLKNKAYGYFQIRQPFVDECHRVLGIKLVDRAEELLENEDAQIIYVVAMLDYMIEKMGEKKGILSYNMGMGSVKKGRENNYYNKVMEAKGGK